MAEKNTSRLSIFNLKLCSGRMVQWYKVSFFALEEVGVQVHIPGGLFPMFFHRIFTLWLVSVYSHCF